MGSDLFALNALAKELNDSLVGARIDKIQQPEVDELRFFMRSKGKNLCLVASCNAGAPRIHLTESKKQSPKTAPNLCMLLRKYLTYSVLSGVDIFNNDRIVRLKFDAKTEMRDDTQFYLFVEIMNRYSNIVFTDKNLVILDAVKHLPLDITRDHVVLRGVIYAPPTQKKTSYLTDCSAVFDNYVSGDIHKYMLDNLSGFSGATVSEILYRAGIENGAQSLDETQKETLKNTVMQFANIEELQPCIIDGKEAYPIVYSSLAKPDMSNVERFATMSDAFDALNTDCDKEIRNKARLKSLATITKRQIQKIEKNIANDLQKLQECEDMEKFRIYGELVVNNIYRIQRGDESLKCLDYYSGKEVEIPLDKQLSPSKNSAFYYAKYNKLKRTKEFVEKKLVEDEELLEYVKSIEYEIASLPYESDTFAIEEELNALSGGKKFKQKSKVRNPKAENPYIYSVDGFDIYMGKNNLQNDELTFKFASSNDVWLHLKNEHGAHTVIVAQGREIPEKVLKIACEITASTKNASADVDYTARKNVKRKPNSHPGQVIYVNYKTMLATPNRHEEYLIKK